ncbi:putative 7-deoxyloganetin glucosyltransferase [Helianthus annuus]|uniref:7-deoxyloganetin glucosyltransferase n=1 Tax=Helianthus annuus TaxID=4232 RepID=A0A9K3H4R4_HELAN|nr:putative 7-deoxyloganetin glucosyltransferase [Helianthus annuus]KAJ0452527.1 putative 7-deoxyloganetin glucosyltransferase [Helianthus annuus]KAJ0457457.1 putative 7-deoxyloganetin glucosyltransferase [Helianthus annuus]KAJ0474433.1 putative 7-deoxyloganetin glucosyltransferase [Helianthus annuus]KAJ0649991.1 putative 7-deoxyloganetin glucosyltransferase [Helianthus annuus]
MKNIHILAIPYPAQGHVMPLMEATRCFTTNSLKVAFVNTEFIHKRLMSACLEIDCPSDLMQLVSIPDGMEPCDDRNDLGKLTKAMFQLMPTKLEELINDINKNDDEKITCIIADCYMGWVLRSCTEDEY